MLHNSLYSWQVRSTSANSVVYEVLFNRQHPLYEGHFPGQPVTPGVVLGEIVKELLEKHLDLKLGMTDLRQIKFLSPHNPDSNPEMEITIKWQNDEGYLVQASGIDNSIVFFKMTARYRPL